MSMSASMWGPQSAVHTVAIFDQGRRAFTSGADLNEKVSLSGACRRKKSHAEDFRERESRCKRSNYGQFDRYKAQTADVPLRYIHLATNSGSMMRHQLPVVTMGRSLNNAFGAYLAGQFYLRPAFFSTNRTSPASRAHPLCL